MKQRQLELTVCTQGLVVNIQGLVVNIQEQQVPGLKRKAKSGHLRGELHRREFRRAVPMGS